MVDYFPVLNRAVGALDPNTSDARRGVYDRARRALIDGLRASDPTLSETDLRAQSVALERAIRQVESQYEGEAPQGAKPAPPPPPVASRVPPPMPSSTPPRVAPDIASAAPEPAPEPGEQLAEEYPDQPPLDEERKPYKMIAAGVAALVVLLGAAAGYTYWPSGTKTAAPAPQRTPTAAASSTPAAQRRVDPDAVGAGGGGYVFLRQPVYYRTTHPVGTIVVDKSQNFLYVVRPSLSAIRYGIAVGPECNAAAGLYQIVRKEEWPGFKGSGKSTDEDRATNPLGARAIYLSKESRIHGTNAPSSIGKPAPGGCIRLTNDDVVYLYDRSPMETRVIVQ